LCQHRTIRLRKAKAENSFERLLFPILHIIQNYCCNPQNQSCYNKRNSYYLQQAFHDLTFAVSIMGSVNLWDSSSCHQTKVNSKNPMTISYQNRTMVKFLSVMLSFDGLRANATTSFPSASACSTSCLPVSPVAPKIVILI